MHELFFEERGIYYRINDFVEGRPTLIFVHGLSGSSSAWKKYEEKFLNKYNILSYDLLGHGKSNKPKSYKSYEMSKFSSDLGALLEYLKIKRCILVSHSFATLIVLEFLATLPENVEASIFLSASYSVKNRIISRILKPVFQLSRAMGVLPFSEKSGTHIDYSKYRNTGDWNIPRMIADVGNTTPRVYFYCTLQSYSVDKGDFLSHVKIPVLLVHGKKDTIFPVGNSIFMNKKIQDSELVLVDEADHIVVLNNFEEVSAAIEQFVDKKRALKHD